MLESGLEKISTTEMGDDKYVLLTSVIERKYSKVLLDMLEVDIVYIVESILLDWKWLNKPKSQPNLY